jgi:hypothetical protein
MRFHDQSGGEAPPALGITNDGVAGPVTWRALVGGTLSG